jgi:hypothetical protein
MENNLPLLDQNILNALKDKKPIKRITHSKLFKVVEHVIIKVRKGSLFEQSFNLLQFSEEFKKKFYVTFEGEKGMCYFFKLNLHITNYN